MAKTFQPLPLTSWQETRDTLANYTRFVRRIRQFNSPHQKHYWHVSLRPTTTGLTTTPIRTTDGIIYELEFDLTHHVLQVKTSRGELREIPLQGQSPKQFKEQSVAALAELGMYPEYDDEEFNEDVSAVYDKTAVAANSGSRSGLTNCSVTSAPLRSLKSSAMVPTAWRCSSDVSLIHTSIDDLGELLIS